jgi:hypothetical protein
MWVDNNNSCVTQGVTLHGLRQTASRRVPQFRGCMWPFVPLPYGFLRESSNGAAIEGRPTAMLLTCKSCLSRHTRIQCWVGVPICFIAVNLRCTSAMRSRQLWLGHGCNGDNSVIAFLLYGSPSNRRSSPSATGVAIEIPHRRAERRVLARSAQQPCQKLWRQQSRQRRRRVFGVRRIRWLREFPATHFAATLGPQGR